VRHRNLERQALRLFNQSYLLSSIETTEPKQCILIGRRADTLRISGAYEIDDADLGVTKFDKGQLSKLYTETQPTEWYWIILILFVLRVQRRFKNIKERSIHVIIT
jgi:hypothetical protein